MFLFFPKQLSSVLNRLESFYLKLFLETIKFGSKSFFLNFPKKLSSVQNRLESIYLEVFPKQLSSVQNRPFWKSPIFRTLEFGSASLCILPICVRKLGRPGIDLLLPDCNPWRLSSHRTGSQLSNADTCMYIHKYYITEAYGLVACRSFFCPLRPMTS